MTTRFKQSLACLNGPKEGYWIDAPSAADVGTATAIPWRTIRGRVKYAVYVVVAQPEAANALMFVQSHETTDRAQQHVQRLTGILTTPVPA